MSRTQAVYYRDTAGVEPVDVFLNGVPTKAAAKIDDAIDEHLNGKAADAPPPEFPHSSQTDGELRELRVRFAHTRYRVLYQRSDNLIVLLHAIEKNRGDSASCQSQGKGADARLQVAHERHPEGQTSCRG